MNILLVDDDESTRITLGFELKHAGLTVTTATDGDQALRLLDRGTFDVLVTDGDMAPLDGLSLAAAAAAIRPQLLIVMISGVFDARDIAGTAIKRLFPKPVSVEQLLSYLRTPLPV